MARRKTTRGYYQNEAGDMTCYLDSLKKVVVVDGVTWKRIAKPEPPSRSKRRDDAAEQIRNMASILEELMNQLEEKREEEGAVLSDEERSAAESICCPEDARNELESLKDELQEWLDNLPENLQSSNKASMLEDAIGSLETAIDYLDSFEELDLDDDIDAICSTLDSNISSLNDAADEAEGVEFPTMFS